MKKVISDLISQFLQVKERGSFAQNVSIVFSGNVLNLIIQLGLAPIISRVYGPEAYGEYAYYNLVVSNIVFFASMSLPSIFILPKTRVEFLALGKMVFFGSLLLIALALTFFMCFEGVFFSYKGTTLTIPLIISLVLIACFNSVGGAWNARSKRFGKNTYTNVIGNFSAKLSTLGIGYLFVPTGLGLLLGDWVKSIVAFFTQTSLSVRLAILRFLFSISNWRYSWSVLINNINVPKYIFPSQIINKWTGDLPILIIGGYYSKETLGYYTFAITILNLPRNIISNAIRPVFLQKLNEVYLKDKREMGSLLYRVVLLTFSITFIPVLLVSIYAPEVFNFVFGEQWSHAGKVVSVIAVQFFFSTIAESFGGVRRILRLEKRIFQLTILSLVFRLAPLLVLFWDVSFFRFVLIFALSNTFFIILSFTDLFNSLLPKRKFFHLVMVMLIALIAGCTIGFISISTL